MSVGEVCNREIVTAVKSLSVAEASQLMRNHQVNDLVVVEENEGRSCASGIITNRDIVTEVMATGAAPDSLTVGDVVNPAHSTVQEDDGIFEAMRHMKEKGAQRMPVVDCAGEPVGIVNLDKLLRLMKQEMAAPAR